MGPSMCLWKKSENNIFILYSAVEYKTLHAINNNRINWKPYKQEEVVELFMSKIGNKKPYFYSTSLIS